MARAFGRPKIEEVEILPSDFCKVLANEGKVARMTSKLDALARELKRTDKRSVSAEKARVQVGSVKEMKRSGTKVRRNAIVYVEPMYGSTYSDDLHSTHSKAIYKMLELIPSIEYGKKLNKEIYSIRKTILKKQIIADIFKYSEYWVNAADINADDLKEADKFLAKVKKSSEDLKAKYGEKVYFLIEHIIKQIIRYPMRKKRIDKEYGNILSTAIALIIRKDKGNLYDPKSFPHPIMIFHEVHFFLIQ